MTVFSFNSGQDVLKASFLAGALLLFAGCGGGSGGDSTAGGGKPGEATEMIKGKIYTVYPGDKIVKTAAGTQVWISHQKDHAQSQVKLLSGGANLIRH